MEVNKIQQWVTRRSFRRKKTTPKKSRESSTCVERIRNSGPATKRNYRISRKRYTWSSSTTHEKSRIFRRSTTKNWRKWSICSYRCSDSASGEWQRSQWRPKSAIWSFGRTSWQTFTLSKRRQSWRLLSISRRERSSCRNYRSRSWDWCRKSTNTTLSTSKAKSSI